MLNTGRLVEASDLAVDYINAVLGSGKEHFGLETPLVATAPPTWLPLNTIEVLLSELKYLNKDSTYVEVRYIYKIDYIYIYTYMLKLRTI